MSKILPLLWFDTLVSQETVTMPVSEYERHLPRGYHVNINSGLCWQKSGQVWIVEAFHDDSQTLTVRVEQWGLSKKAEIDEQP